MWEPRQAPALLNICTACRSTSPCPGRHQQDVPWGIQWGQRTTSPSYQGSLQPSSQLPQGEKGSKFLSPGNRDVVNTTNLEVSSAACLGQALPPAPVFPPCIPKHPQTRLCSHHGCHSTDVCSEQALMFADSGPCSLHANAAGLPGTHIARDTH